MPVPAPIRVGIFLLVAVVMSVLLEPPWTSCSGPPPWRAVSPTLHALDQIPLDVISRGYVPCRRGSPTARRDLATSRPLHWASIGNPPEGASGFIPAEAGTRPNTGRP